MGKRIKIQAAAAVALGVTVQTLVAWKRQPWWNTDWQTKDGYDVEAIQKRPGAEEANQRGKYDESSRKMNQASRAIDLQLKQMQLQERSGELVDIKFVINAFESYHAAVVSGIEDLPVQIARMIPEGKLRAKVLSEGSLKCSQTLRSAAQMILHHFSKLKGGKK